MVFAKLKKKKEKKRKRKKKEKKSKKKNKKNRTTAVAPPETSLRTYREIIKLYHGTKNQVRAVSIAIILIFDLSRSLRMKSGGAVELQIGVPVSVILWCSALSCGLQSTEWL